MPQLVVTPSGECLWDRGTYGVKLWSIPDCLECEPTIKALHKSTYLYNYLLRNTITRIRWNWPAESRVAVVWACIRAIASAAWQTMSLGIVRFGNKASLCSAMKPVWTRPSWNSGCPARSSRNRILVLRPTICDTFKQTSDPSIYPICASTTDIQEAAVAGLTTSWHQKLMEA